MSNTVVPIISIPHPHLRRVARPITLVTPGVIAMSERLSTTLKHTKNPKGVGLAAPQIDEDWRVFATQLDGNIELFFNPRFSSHSDVQSFGENEDEPDLEGCLSIPEIYGPVPRWSWVELEFDQLKGNSFVQSRRRFTGFPARVIQHEYDHLEGILFIDYSLELNLPVYAASSRSDKMTEIPREVFETLQYSTRVA